MWEKPSSPERITSSFGTEKKAVRISPIQPKFTARNSSSGSASSARTAPPPSRCRSSGSFFRRRQQRSERASISGTKGQTVA